MNEGTFSAEDLVACYAPPNLRSVMPGNKVMLRSGGPEMIVTGVDAGGYAICVWPNDAGILQRRAFALECLTCYGAK
jgi:uncharacterized protein YodC (DUF2158 family)